jgi:hypothetical protein
MLRCCCCPCCCSRCCCTAVSFSRGRPFKPFEQLLAVLPSASCSLLPPAFQWLMTDSNSPILDFYPEKFDIDMEGKRAEWEGVVKVPFISEERLLAAAASVPPERCALICLPCYFVFSGEHLCTRRVGGCAEGAIYQWSPAAGSSCQRAT